MMVLRKGYDWFKNHPATGWFAVSLLVFMLFLFVVLPAESAKSALLTGSADSPDLHLYYNPAQLLAIAEEYGVAGREYYIASRFSFDIVWPLAYLFFLIAAANLVFTKRQRPRLRMLAFGLIGAAFVFDLLENQLVSHVMRAYPSPVPLVLGLAGVATALKWATLVVAFLGLVAGTAATLLTRRKAQTNGQIEQSPL